MARTVRNGAVQAEPAWLDLQGGVKKTISLIQQVGLFALQNCPLLAGAGCHDISSKLAWS